MDLMVAYADAAIETAERWGLDLNGRPFASQEFAHKLGAKR